MENRENKELIACLLDAATTADLDWSSEIYDYADEYNVADELNEELGHEIGRLEALNWLGKADESTVDAAAKELRAHLTRGTANKVFAYAEACKAHLAALSDLEIAWREVREGDWEADGGYAAAMGHYIAS